MVGDPTWIDPGGKGRPEIQMSTILSVDLDSPPVWHLGVCFRHWSVYRDGQQVKDHLFMTAHWYPWMWDLATEALFRLIPKAETRERTFRDVHPFSVDFRSVLDQEEALWLATMAKRNGRGRYSPVWAEG